LSLTETRSKDYTPNGVFLPDFLKPVITIAYYTGLRRGEILAMTKLGTYLATHGHNLGTMAWGEPLC